MSEVKHLLTFKDHLHIYFCVLPVRVSPLFFIGFLVFSSAFVYILAILTPYLRCVTNIFSQFAHYNLCFLPYQKIFFNVKYTHIPPLFLI